MCVLAKVVAYPLDESLRRRRPTGVTHSGVDVDECLGPMAFSASRHQSVRALIRMFGKTCLSSPIFSISESTRIRGVAFAPETSSP